MRKGKALKLNFSPSEISAAAVRVDPGMIIAPLSRQTSEVSESQVEEHVSSIPVKIEEEVPEALQSSLLEFEADFNLDGIRDLKAEEPLDQLQKSHELSDLDLLTELDFDALHVGTEKPSHSSTNTPQSSFQPPSSSPIPDAFVLQAAGDMYPEIRDGRAVSMAQQHIAGQHDYGAVNGQGAFQKSSNPFAD